MKLKCQKCGVGFGHHANLVINDDPVGYRCTSCFTLHSWIDGVIIPRKIHNSVDLRSTDLRGGETN